MEFSEEDWRRIEKMLISHCGLEEICGAMNITGREKEFKKLVKEKYGLSFDRYKEVKFGVGNALLKMKQLEVALNGDRFMLMWLGKQWLGQKERVSEEKLAEMDKSIKIEIVSNGVPLNNEIEHKGNKDIQRTLPKHETTTIM